MNTGMYRPLGLHELPGVTVNKTGVSKYSGTWELGTPKGLQKTVLNSEVVFFLRSISMYWIGLGTEVHVAVLNSQAVPILRWS